MAGHFRFDPTGMISDLLIMLHISLYFTIVFVGPNRESFSAFAVIPCRDFVRALNTLMTEGILLVPKTFKLRTNDIINNNSKTLNMRILKSKIDCFLVASSCFARATRFIRT